MPSSQSHKELYPFQLGKKLFGIRAKQGESNTLTEKTKKKVIKLWLSRIGKSICHAMLKSRVNKPADSENTLPLVTTYYSNSEMQKKLNWITKTFKRVQTKQLAKYLEANVLFLKRPLNLLKLLSLNSKNPQLSQGLFACSKEICKLLTLYIKSCTNFKALNNAIWYIRNVIHFLKCTNGNHIHWKNC